MSTVEPASRRTSVLWDLTERELRGQLIVLFAVLWTVAVVTFALPGIRLPTGQIKGTDFIHFYTIGSAVARGQADVLYDAAGLAALQETLVPGSSDVRYIPVYGPQVALVFAPLTRLPYLGAFLAWAGVTFVLYGLCVFYIWRDCRTLRERRGLVILSAAAFFPFWQLIEHGQTTALPLLSLTAVWFALKADRLWLVGIAIGTLAVKPQLALAFVCLCLAARQWKVIGGAAVALAAQVVLVWGTIGNGPLYDYVGVLARMGSFAHLLEPNLAQLHSLRSFWALLVPDPWSTALYLVSSAVVLLYAIRLWRGRGPLALRYGSACVATVLVAPHLTIYDLSILAPTLLLAADWALARWTAGGRPVLLARSIVAVYALPLLPIASLIRIQLSVPALAVFFWALALPLGSPQVGEGPEGPGGSEVQRP